MSDANDRVSLLFKKLDELLKRQDALTKDIYQIKNELSLIPLPQENEISPQIIQEERKEEIIHAEEVNKATPELKEAESIYQRYKENHKDLKEKSDKAIRSVSASRITAAGSSSIEKFVGENLINKIGIAITVIGVGIGAKYSIEHELISPLTRIILGYLTGAGLMAFAIKLKNKYENFSAVLLSGAMAIMYFISYAAYSFYGLIPQIPAFLLMVVFTAFTVFAAIKYNRQVIAIIGLAGAYAVPFLLSDGSGRVAVLFTYMAMINTGILVISFKKYWKALYYTAFILTWLIFYIWFAFQYDPAIQIFQALIFSTIFFAIFYAVFLSYKLFKKEPYEALDGIVLLLNAFIYYGIGYAVLNGNESLKVYSGLYTVLNAVVHFGIAYLIYNRKLADRHIFYILAGLVLVFITIAIPIQMNGDIVTLLWALEAALLFSIGRQKGILIYEYLSYAVMLIAFISFTDDWNHNYNLSWSGEKVDYRAPLINMYFLSSALFVAAFAYMTYVAYKTNGRVSNQHTFQKVSRYFIPALFLSALYISFRSELLYYWDHLYSASAVTIRDLDIRNSDLLHKRNIWSLNYTLLFLSLLSFINLKRIRSHDLGIINLILNTVSILTFLAVTIFQLSTLRESYINPEHPEFYDAGIFNILLRYITFAFAGLNIYFIYLYIKDGILKQQIPLKMIFDIFLSFIILYVLSSELITWMDILQFPQSFKLGISILWGLYSLLLILLGIWKKLKHLRIAAIVLFGITLVKLFLYDISDLDTIAKTIVFVSLGVLLLVISFLYNKYKILISGENEK